MDNQNELSLFSVVKNCLVSHTQKEDWLGIELGLCYAFTKVEFSAF